MMHLMKLNETAGAGWRHVDEAEMERLMRQQRADKFGAGEVRAILETIAGLGARGELQECVEWGITPFSAGMCMKMFWGDSHKLRVHLVPSGKVIDRWAKPWLDNPPPNALYFERVPGPNAPFERTIGILKSVDEYFFLSLGGEECFVCDQLPGVVSAIKHIIGA
jgi:hypothetical protein